MIEVMIVKTVKAMTLVGNPKIGSRTLNVAEEVTRQVGAWIETQGVTIANSTVDIAALGAGLLDWENKAVNDVLQKIAESGLLVVASPTYKATYTGLLKLLLDRIPMEGLAGRVAIPVMVAAAPIHVLAVETHLRPVLVELGASCPTRGLVVLESKLGELSEVVAKWLEGAKPMLGPLLRKD
jgi:FMN reductase